ncbi:hypothetical protein NECAME_06090 [Necator americanus]|uniref:Uncharacterized protein n=1 Tax=Necator americanus TaxID=51031 RepID=W2TYL1_NECAM|nr:hypothetical protein NECAME_06090 [Necator americanus]ETN86117.1 hypothetical protein NECAME_06090 [Necator americanus]
MATAIVPVFSVALLAHAVYQYQHDINWWMYVPAYGLAGTLCIFPSPSLSLWRGLSSVAVIGGGLLMLFLTWTFHGLEGSPGLELSEAKNLLPIAIGVAITTGTRLSLDTNQRILHYIRSLILVTLFILSSFISVYSIKYYLM